MLEPLQPVTRRNPDLSVGNIRYSAAIGVIALAAVSASLYVAPGLRGVLGGSLAAIMLAIAIVDARWFIIPNRLTLVAAGLGLAHAVLESEAVVQAASIAVIRGAILGLAFLLLRAVYLRVRGRDGIGLGDAKLAAVGGLWLDWMAMAFSVEIAAFSALGLIAVRTLRGHKVSSATPIPFGLFLAPAIWIGWLFEWGVLRAP